MPFPHLTSIKDKLTRFELELGVSSDVEGYAADHEQLYEGVGDRTTPWTSEAVGGAVALETIHVYEEKCAAEGKPETYAAAKDMVQQIAGAEVDKVFDPKGIRGVNKDHAKLHAVKEALAVVAKDYN